MDDDFELNPNPLEDEIVNGTKDNSMLKYALTRTSSGDAGKRSSQPNPQERSKGQETTTVQVQASDSIKLPQRFVVKYLGVRETTNLWGVKHTRGPVDDMVSEAKRILSTSTGTLPLLTLEVTPDGVTVGPMPQNTNGNYPQGRFPIEAISYGVQDIVYTRVFAMIVVKPIVDPSGTTMFPKLSQINPDHPASTSTGPPPFRCHAFVTDKRETAKNLTYALAEAFQKFSHKVAAGGKVMTKRVIDLRSGQEFTMDSEA